MNALKEIVKKTILIFLSIKVFFVLKSLDINKKNLFIDLGTNKGQGFNYFKKFFKLDIFDYILVEPNPNLENHIRKLIQNTNFGHKIEFINKAAHINDSNTKLLGTIEDERGKTSEGASIIREHNSKMYISQFENGLDVQTFDFVKKLESLKQYDNIIIKMDVEGSEYDILENIINNLDHKDNIKHIFVEFHSRFLSYEYKNAFIKREKIIKKELNKANINFTQWI